MQLKTDKFSEMFLTVKDSFRPLFEVVVTIAGQEIPPGLVLRSLPLPLLWSNAKFN